MKRVHSRRNLHIRTSSRNQPKPGWLQLEAAYVTVPKRSCSRSCKFYHCFASCCLWKHVDALNPVDFVAFSEENEITGQGGRVAGNVDKFGWIEFKEGVDEGTL